MSERPPEQFAKRALLILTLVNMFNYLDRYVVAALVEPLRNSELQLTDAQAGSLMTGFLLVYMVISPLFGYLGDRRSRPKLVALGVAVWSIATALAELAWNFTSLFIARAAVGVGEAAYGTIAPAMLGDFFPKTLRGRVFSVFFMAIPVGSALGYLLGGYVASTLGWRWAFAIAGIPGLFLAALVLLVKDPPRGGQDQEMEAKKEVSIREYLSLVKNRNYMMAVVGYGAYTFALGGLAYWMPAFLERARGMDTAQANMVVGGITVVTGFLGTFIGGWLADWLFRRTDQANMWVSGLSAAVAIPATFLALTSPNPAVYLPAITFAELFLFMSTGPINAAIIGAVSPNKRAMAVGFSIFVMHILGDVPATYIIGVVSDHSSLAEAVLLVPSAVVVCAIIWTVAAVKPKR